MSTPAPDRDPENSAHIDLYWRPGCGFCSSLRRRLDVLGVERREHDIWSDPEAAATVRSHARGNETVPTVVIGDVGLVNPSAADVVATIRELAPDLLPADLDHVESEHDGAVSRFMGRLLGS